MTVNLINALFNNLRCNITRLHLKSGFQIRTSTTMEVAPVEESNELVAHKGRTRYKKRFMKRQWEDSRKDENEPQDKTACVEKVERIKKKKVAMLLGYCGVNYYGMQRNPGVLTIEEDLLKALKDAKYVSEMDFENLDNLHFQRSSRTDKGVSAERQVVSLKMPLECNIEEINKRLPECIRVFDIKRVTNKFNSKGKCDARTYSYTLPTYVFDSSLITNEDRKAYRITKEKLDRVNELLALYKGTKCYHNFTARKSFNDPSSNRYMMSCAVEKVFVNSDMEFAVILIKGQSFMLHQIRKMVGLTIAIVRGHAESGVLEKVFTKEKVMLPTAPGLGLVLNYVHYDRYNKKFQSTHDTLIWDDQNEAVEKFTSEFIHPTIIAGEVNEDSMGVWLEKIEQHSYEQQEDEAEENGIEKDEENSDSEDTDRVEDNLDSSNSNTTLKAGDLKDANTVKDNSESKDSDEVQETVNSKDTDSIESGETKDTKNL